MAKFYVQCGTRCLVAEAMDAQAAAMHLVDLAMQPQLWIYDDEGLTDSQRKSHVMLETLLHLAPEIHVSERGFDRTDAQKFGAPEIIQTWHETMAGLSKLFVAAGLSPRPMRQLATVGPTSQTVRANKKLDAAEFDLPL